MNSRRVSIVLVLISLAALLLPLQVGQAQDDETCEQFAARVLSDLGLNCANLEDNAACYGFSDVEALLQAAGLTFAEAGDQAELTPMARLTAMPFNLDEKQWGFGMVNVNAFVSTQADGTPELARVIYLLVGDVEIEQAVPATFDEDGALIIDEDHLAPMQNAYLRNGFEQPDCAEIPDPLLLVQSPEDKLITITINGAEIELGSTVAFRITTPVDGIAQYMRMIVINGLAKAYPRSNNPLIVPPGHYVDFCLEAPKSRGIDGEPNDQVISCRPGDPLPLTRGDLARLNILRFLPSNILHYLLDIPTLSCPSGSGAPRCTFVFRNPRVLAAARVACQMDLLPDSICRRLFP